METTEYFLKIYVGCMCVADVDEDLLEKLTVMLGWSVMKIKNYQHSCVAGGYLEKSIVSLTFILSI